MALSERSSLLLVYTLYAAVIALQGVLTVLMTEWLRLVGEPFMILGGTLAMLYTLLTLRSLTDLAMHND